MGGVASCSPKLGISGSNLDDKMAEAVKRRAEMGSSMRSFASIILKFPKIDESLRECKTIFERFDADSNGAIDPRELRDCFMDMKVKFSEEEASDLFAACDVHENMGINFNEFVVLLCLVYLLKGSSDPHGKERAGDSKLEATFEILIDAFVFLDKNKDGYVSKSEMVEAVQEVAEGQNNAGCIAMERFEEMDWDKNGMVTFKEFLFAFTQWIGMDDPDDEN